MKKEMDSGQLQLTRVSNTKTNLHNKNNILKKNSQADDDKAPFLWDFDTAYWMIDELADIPSQHLEHRKLTRSTIACIFNNNTCDELEIDDLRNLVKQKLKIQKSAINAIANEGGKQKKMTHHDMVISLTNQLIRFK